MKNETFVFEIGGKKTNTHDDWNKFKNHDVEVGELWRPPAAIPLRTKAKPIARFAGISV